MISQVTELHNDLSGRPISSVMIHDVATWCNLRPSLTRLHHLGWWGMFFFHPFSAWKVLARHFLRHKQRFLSSWTFTSIFHNFMVNMVCNHLGYLARKPLGARNLSFTGHRSTGCIGIRLQTSSGWPSCWSKRLKNQRLGHCVVM